MTFSSGLIACVFVCVYKCVSKNRCLKKEENAMIKQWNIIQLLQTEIVSLAAMRIKLEDNCIIENIPCTDIQVPYDIIHSEVLFNI